jgi:RNA polymerase sigma-70 factor (ECF subfamily)
MVSDHTVQTWLTQATAGDLHAIQKLIIAHHARLRDLAVKRMPQAMRSKFEPEDILQQVYIDVVQHIRDYEYRGSDSFFHWLVRILDSKLIDAQRFYRAAARNIRRQVAPKETTSTYESLVSSAALDLATPSRILARQETESILLAALAGLSQDQRRVIELRYLQGHTLAEVAEMMQRSVPAVQMLSARAMRQLRSAIQRLSGI